MTTNDTIDPPYMPTHRQADCQIKSLLLHFKGIIVDVRIYRRALKVFEVAALVSPS